MKNILFGLLAMASLFACEKTIQLDVKQVEETLIIDAKVTTDLQQHVVKLSKSQPFASKGNSAGVTGAQVFVKDDANHEYRFLEKEAGVYVAETAFAGVTGRTYTLMVNVGGKTYTATEKMNKIVPYDSLTYRIDEEEKLDPQDSGRYYEALLYVHEPQESQDFYLFQFYRNGKLENEDGQTIYFSEDKLLNGRVDGLPFPLFYAAKDEAKIEIYNISPSAYKFYSDLSASLGSDGGIFSGQPANVYTNLSGGAKGFFLVAPVASGSIKIDF